MATIWAFLHQQARVHKHSQDFRKRFFLVWLFSVSFGECDDVPSPSSSTGVAGLSGATGPTGTSVSGQQGAGPPAGSPYAEDVVPLQGILHDLYARRR